MHFSIQLLAFFLITLRMASAGVITDLIQQAQPGDTVFIPAGIFSDTVSLPDGVNLFGAGPDSTILTNSKIILEGTSLVKNLWMRETETGFVIMNSGSLIKNCIISSVSVDAVTAATFSAVMLVNTTFVNNRGNLVRTKGGATTLINNIFGFNSGWFATGDLYDSIAYCDFWQNSQQPLDFVPDSLSEHDNLYLDPLFQDTVNFKLSSFSLLIDRGAPYLKDRDQTVSDLGAFGGMDSDDLISISRSQHNPAHTLDWEIHPHPLLANGGIHIKIALAVSPQTPVLFSLLNLNGKELRRWREKVISGFVKLDWDGKDFYGKGLGSGVFLFRVEAVGTHLLKTIVYLK